MRRRTSEDPQDPGFGAKVSAASGRRLLNRDGTFNARRRGLRATQSWSTYHVLLNMSWRGFVLVSLGAYVVLNVVFALAYVACGPGAVMGLGGARFGPRLLDCFFLSVQTLTTVGYGHVAPVSVAANLVAAAEMFCGVLLYAIAAGLAFARFSRPMARIVFSDRAVIAPYGDGTALMFRFANVRRSEIVEVEVRALFTWLKGGAENPTRRYYALDLERTHVAFVPLHLTVVHPITPDSPLYGATKEELESGAAELMVLVTAVDETFSQRVHARTSYTYDEIQFDARFSMVLSLSSDGMVEADLRRFHETEPVERPETVP